MRLLCAAKSVMRPNQNEISTKSGQPTRGDSALAMIIFVAISKKGYLQRHIVLWNGASKLSYVVILLGLPLLGASLGLLYGAQRQIPPLLEAQVQPLLVAQMPGLQLAG
jgi:hypothetical protein